MVAPAERRVPVGYAGGSDVTTVPYRATGPAQRPCSRRRKPSILRHTEVHVRLGVRRRGYRGQYVASRVAVESHVLIAATAKAYGRRCSADCCGRCRAVVVVWASHLS